MDLKYILIQYFDHKRSVVDIAEELGTYPNKINRLIKKAGFELRSKSESQKLSLESGRAEHPTLGKQVSPETKEKIGSTLAKTWTDMPPKKKQKIIDGCKKRYKSMSNKKKTALREAAVVGLLKAAKEGSKIEHFVMDELKNAGYEIVFHKTGLIPNDKLEVDIFIPALKTAIEIDGVGHFDPVWGDKKLKKQQDADLHKNGLLITYGYRMLRIKYTCKNFGRIAKDKIKNLLFASLQRMIDGNENYIEVEI